MPMQSIRVYIADYEKLGIDRMWESLLPYLASEEKERVLRYKFEADRIRSATGAFLIRRAAAKSFPGEEIIVKRTDEGKPYIPGRPGFEFSLSHSGKLIVLALSDRPVGVDVELIKGKDWHLFHRYLTEKEMSMIESADDPAARFFDVWTVREALSKEEGIGLRILDRKFTVDYAAHTISYEGRTLYFWTGSYHSSESYSLSLCSPEELRDVELMYLDKEPDIRLW